MLSHTHPMSDPDAIFEIDPTTRIISTNVKKIVLMQYDHNSEIFTFSIPQFVEGHDMSLCNKIEIHYTNINKRTREQSKDVYSVTDKQVRDNNLVFTWLLSGNATKYPGSLNFIIRFECVEDYGSISYMWHTDIFKNVTVSDGISNTESVIEDYSDILEQWKSEVDINLETIRNEIPNVPEWAMAETKPTYTAEEVGAMSADTAVVKSVNGNAPDETGNVEITLHNADWNQTDETQQDYIKNKPLIATDDDTVDFLSEMEVITPVTNSDGEILISSSNEIYSL